MYKFSYLIPKFFCPICSGINTSKVECIHQFFSGFAFRIFLLVFIHICKFTDKATVILWGIPSSMLFSHMIFVCFYKQILTNFLFFPFRNPYFVSNTMHFIHHGCLADFLPGWKHFCCFTVACFHRFCQ